MDYPQLMVRPAGILCGVFGLWASTVANAALASTEDVALTNAVASHPAETAGGQATGRKPGRHGLSIQFGGSAFFTVNYRFRLHRLLELDVGGLGAPECINGGIGVVSEWLSFDRVGVYSSLGRGVYGCGGICEDNDPDCVQSDFSAYWYARLGFALRFGETRQHAFLIDGGLWDGENEVKQNDVVTKSPMRRPMVGFAYLRRF